MKSTKAAIMALIVVAVGLTACGVVGSAANALANRAQSAYYRHTTCQPTTYSGLAWANAPDGSGTQIYYTVYDGATERRNLRAMDDQGGDDRLLVSDAGVPDPSPGGRWVLYQDTSGTTPTIQHSLLDLQSMTIRKLGDMGYTPGWSAGTGSQSIVYARVDPSAPISRMDAASGATTAILKPLDTAVFGDGYPQASPAGGLIAFMSDRGGPISIYVVGTDGKGLARLRGQDEPACSGPVSGPVENTLAGWRPDGTRIMTMRGCGRNTSLNVLALDADHPEWTFSADVVYSAAWSPDGSHILIVAQPDINKPPELMVVDADGSHMQTVRANVGDYAWSPDSKRIAFVDRDPSGLSEVYTMALDGTDVRQLTHNPGVGMVCPH